MKKISFKPPKEVVVNDTVFAYINGKLEECKVDRVSQYGFEVYIKTEMRKILDECKLWGYACPRYLLKFWKYNSQWAFKKEELEK